MIFTIGHSTHSREQLIELLHRHAITAIYDVRSRPYSRMNPQFNREHFKAVLSSYGIEYLFLGRELGARSEDPACYAKGKVQYDVLARTPLFRDGLDQVLRGAEESHIALMCAEKEPLECHRSILIARHLEGVQHIHADGSIESHSAAIHRLKEMLGLPEKDLFRSSDEIAEEAYRLQGERIAYETGDATRAIGSAAG